MGLSSGLLLLACGFHNGSLLPAATAERHAGSYQFQESPRTLPEVHEVKKVQHHKHHAEVSTTTTEELGPDASLLQQQQSVEAFHSRQQQQEAQSQQVQNHASDATSSCSCDCCTVEETGHRERVGDFMEVEIGCDLRFDLVGGDMSSKSGHPNSSFLQLRRNRNALSNALGASASENAESAEYYSLAQKQQSVDEWQTCATAIYGNENYSGSSSFPSLFGSSSSGPPSLGGSREYVGGAPVLLFVQKSKTMKSTRRSSSSEEEGGWVAFDVAASKESKTSASVVSGTETRSSHSSQGSPSPVCHRPPGDRILDIEEFARGDLRRAEKHQEVDYTEFCRSECQPQEAARGGSCNRKPNRRDSRTAKAVARFRVAESAGAKAKVKQHAFLQQSVSFPSSASPKHAKPSGTNEAVIKLAATGSVAQPAQSASPSAKAVPHQGSVAGSRRGKGNNVVQRQNQIPLRSKPSSSLLSTKNQARRRDGGALDGKIVGTGKFNAEGMTVAQKVRAKADAAESSSTDTRKAEHDCGTVTEKNGGTKY